MQSFDGQNTATLLVSSLYLSTFQEMFFVK